MRELRRGGHYGSTRQSVDATGNERPEDNSRDGGQEGLHDGAERGVSDDLEDEREDREDELQEGAEGGEDVAEDEQAGDGANGVGGDGLEVGLGGGEDGGDVVKVANDLVLVEGLDISHGGL